MSDIPRWAYQYGGMTPFHPSPGGGWVAYADHVAALLTQDQQHMEQQAAAVAAAEQRVTSDFAKYLRHMVDDDKFAAGVKAARDAVDAIPTSAFDVGIVGKDDALAAIDALEKP